MNRTASRSTIRFLIATHLLLASSAVVAQMKASSITPGAAANQVADNVTSQIDAARADHRQIVQSQGPATSFGYSPTAPQLQLSANRGESEATLALAAAIERTRSQYDEATGDDRRTSWTSRLYLRGITPLGDDKAADRFVNLDDPLSGSRITVGFAHYFSNYTIHRRDIVDQLNTRTTAISDCVSQAVAAWRAEPTRTPQEVGLADNYLAAYRHHLALEPRPELALLDTNADEAFGDIPESLRDRCLNQDGNEFLAMIGTYSDNVAVDRAAMLRSIVGRSPTFFFGGEATVSQHDFSFLDRTAFKINDATSHREYAFSAFAGVIGWNGRWSLRAGVSATRTYDEQDPIELCRPVTGTSDSQCLTGPDGAPTRNSETVVSIAGRALIATPLGDIGVAPAVAITTGSGDYTVDVPVYLARNDDGQLTGGLRVGYRSDKDRFSFGFFIGVPFANLLN